MLDPFDSALVRRRRQHFLVLFLLSGAFLAGSVAMIVDPISATLSQATALVFGLSTVQLARLVLAPAELILEMPASLFYILAPSNPSPSYPSSPDRSPVASKTTRAVAYSGVWDRELDQVP